MTDSIARYQNLMDDRLSDLLSSFLEYDFDYKPLLTQREFERQLYPLIEPLMARPSRERYSSVYELFQNVFKLTAKPEKGSILAKDARFQYNKFITLIDICILISKIQMGTFSNFPNEILSDLVCYDLFDDVDDLLSQYGRMNYKFNMRALKLKRREYIRNNPDPNRLKKKKKKKKVVKTTAMLLDELTEKLMSKPIKSDDKDYDGPMPFSEGKNASCRPGKDIKDSFSSSSEEEREGSESDSSDDEFQDAKESLIETKASSRRFINTKPMLKPKINQLVEISEEESESDGPSADDLSDESEDDKEGLINRTTIRLHRKSGLSKRSNRNSSKDYKVVANNDELIPSAIIAKEKLIKRKKRENREKLKSISKSATTLTSKSKLSKKKRRTSSSSSIIKPVMKKNCILSKNRFQSNWRVVIEPNLNFLYSKLESKFPPMEPHMSKPESKGFIYKPAQFSLFEEMNETETFNKAEFKSLDQLINSFLLQSYKRAGGCDYDSKMFLHPLEFAYIQEHLSKMKESSAIKLPPLLFGNRWQSLINNESDGYIIDGVLKLNIKVTKVKELWLLKPFTNEDQYWDHFKKIVPRDKVSKRLEFLNTIISDGDNNLYVCDDLERVHDFVTNNHELLEVSDVEDDAADNGTRNEANSRSKVINEEELIKEGTKDIQQTEEDPSASVTTTDINKVRELDDDRSTTISTLRGVWVSCKSIRRILTPLDQFKILSNFLFPGLRPSKEYHGVPQRAIDDLCDIYSGFRPYLMKLFIDDVFEFASMPQFFQLDSTMFELQAQEYFKKKKKPLTAV